MTLLSRLNFVGLAREAVPGTYQPPNVYIPSQGTPEDVVVPLRDESWKNNYTVVQDIYPGPAHITYDLSGQFYPDTGGHLLRAMLGPDTLTPGVATTLSAAVVAGATAITTPVSIPAGSTISIDIAGLQEVRVTGVPTGAGPFTIPLLNAAAGVPLLLTQGHAAGVAVAGFTLHTFKTALTQPDSYSITEFNGFEARGYAGCKLDTLTLKIDPKGMITYDAKWMGFPSTSQNTPIPVEPLTQPFLGWMWTLAVGGVPSSRGLTLDYTIKRASEAIPASTGTQAPREIFVAGIEFDAKMKAIFENNLDFNNLLTYAKVALLSTLTQPPAVSGVPGGAQLAVSNSRSVWYKIPTNKQSNFMQLDADITGTYNTTDAGPGAVTLLNQQAVSY